MNDSPDTGFTHVDADGRARMIDVGGKSVTRREAVAEGILVSTTEVVELLRRDELKKADALATARIAGIAGAKRTSDLIPLCHPLPIDAVSVDLLPDGDRIRITATVSTSGRTGVEMEALTAVAVAGLTLHDMVKAVDPAASLTEVRLLTKTGGKRGDWSRDAWVAERDGGGDSVVDSTPVSASASGPSASVPSPPDSSAPDSSASFSSASESSASGTGASASASAISGVRPSTAAVLVASTRGATGERPDTTGPVIAEWLESGGYTVDEVAVVADSEAAAALARLVDTRPSVVITTGGTGASPTDVTPEATAPLIDRELPGIAEAIRAAGAKVPTAALSRGLAGVSRGTVIVNLPGSPGGVRDGLGVLDGVLAHLVAQIAGGGDHTPAAAGRHAGDAVIDTAAGSPTPPDAHGGAPESDDRPHRHGPHLHEKKADR